MNYLLKLTLALEREQAVHQEIFNYTIPDLWDCFQYSGSEKQLVGNGEIMVNPYLFFHSLLQDYYLPKTKNQPDLLQPYYQTHSTEFKNGDWIKKSFVYSMSVRSTGSWDSDRNGKLDSVNLYNHCETGTFLRAMAHLPFLHKLGVDTIYLLPISQYSRKNKKGELGSPYSITNFFKLDEDLKDSLTGEYCTVEDEFKAFVEACHSLDMKVVIDIIPRTNSIHSEMILEHPEWFYWIDQNDLPEYRAPMVDDVPATSPAHSHYIPDIYASDEVITHICKFKKNPKELDSEKWEKITNLYQLDQTLDFSELIKKEFGLVIAPAFSDCINDPQPAWTDITYFRMYLDHPVESQPHLIGLDSVEPYILFDVAKSSLNPGSQINTSLWEMISGIIPFYQKEYGIDGARIDMGHALPVQLVDLMIKKAKEIDSDFCFIAEELDLNNDLITKQKGYNIMIGNGFIMEPRIKEHCLNDFSYRLNSLELPVFALGETHDTPRIAGRNGEKTLSKLLTTLNFFLPNSVPFLNSGQEVFEKQPMNLGLDCTVEDLYVLDKEDPYYGKLALFDRYQFHYTAKDRWELPKLIEKASKIRQQYINLLTTKKDCYPVWFNHPDDSALGFAYLNERRGLIVIANTDCLEAHTHKIKLDAVPTVLYADKKVVQVLSSELVPTQTIPLSQSFDLDFLPGEVKVFELK